MKSLIKWAALALVVGAILGIAHQPLYWQRYLAVLAHSHGKAGGAASGDREVPLSFYQPRERVSGGNQPPAPREPPATESLDFKALAEAADYAGARQSRALIVSRNGYIVFERYWKGTSYDTVADAGALGRIITALTVGAAIAERKIGWPDEPIGNFITEWRDDPRGQITVRNLLQLSSGLAAPEESAMLATAGGFAPATDIIAQYLRAPLAAPPGKRWLDQSADADLLAQVIERATKQRYAQYVSQTLWQRIGAADAWLWLDHPGGAAHVDRGFLVHQGDWIRVAELLMKNGLYQGDEVIVPRWIPQLLAPASSNSHYGAYIHLGAHPEAGMTPYVTTDVMLIEGGGNRLWMVPSLQIAILRTGVPPSAFAAGAGGTGGASDWDDARIPNLIIRGARDFVPPAARPGADLRQLVPNH